MVMELVKDNRKIVDRISFKDIDSFVELLQRNKVRRFNPPSDRKKLKATQSG